MGLLDGLDQPQPPQLYHCKVRTVADSLDKADADILLAAVINEKWTINALMVELGKRGIAISKDPLKRHRDRHCSCWKI